MKKWTIEDSKELYNIGGWGTSYFGINDKGDVYDMFCLLIERLALLQLLADEYLYFLRSLVEQQGAYALAHLEVSIEGFWRCLEVDGVARLVHILHVVEETGCSSATANHYVFKLRHLV